MQLREIRRAYGFDEISIVPGSVTINPEMTDTSVAIDGITLSTPILAAAMDAVVSPAFAVKMHEAGGLGVMNLEGVQTRYDDPTWVLAEVANAPQEEVTELLQKLYSAPIREDLIGARVREIKESGAKCAVCSRRSPEYCQQEDRDDSRRKESGEFLNILKRLIEITQQGLRDNHRDHQ